MPSSLKATKAQSSTFNPDKYLTLFPVPKKHQIGGPRNLLLEDHILILVYATLICLICIFVRLEIDEKESTIRPPTNPKNRENQYYNLWHCLEMGK